MSTHLTPAERLRSALTAPTRGVLGLVDELLTVSREQSLRLAWQADHCRVRFLVEGQEDSLEVPLRKSVVRAVLARVAVLCNERKPNSVSPYGGQGELSIGTEPGAVLRVAFVNTSDEQSMEVVCLSFAGGVDGRGQGDQGTKREEGMRLVLSAEQ